MYKDAQQPGFNSLFIQTIASFNSRFNDPPLWPPLIYQQHQSATMPSLKHISLLSLAGLSQARAGELASRADDEVCCPCPASGTPPVSQITITVTESAPAAAPTTVYVTQVAGAQSVQPTVTVTDAGQTVYVTAGHVSPSLATLVADTVTVSGEAQATTVTVNAQPIASESSGVGENAGQPTDSQAVTVASQSTVSSETSQFDDGNASNSDSTPHGPATVTVEVQHSSMDEVASAQTSPLSSNVNNSAEPVTVTVTPPVSDHAGNLVVTQTIQQEEQNPQTVVVSVLPSSSTLHNTSSQTSIESATPVTVTAAPDQTAPLTQTVDTYHTVTQSVTNINGDVDIEINIINIFTGETICKKENGDPCDDNSQPIEPSIVTVSCQEVEPSTSFSTIYNTVYVSTNQTGSHNATAVSGAAAPTGLRARTPRGPAAPRWY
jgi:hypothetical protein